MIIKVKGYEGFARFAGKASSKNTDVQEKIINMIQSAAPEAVRYAHMNIGDYNYTAILKEAQIPLFLIRCEYDRDINKNLKSTLAVLQKHQLADILELPGVGHFANRHYRDHFLKRSITLSTRQRYASSHKKCGNSSGH